MAGDDEVFHMQAENLTEMCEKRDRRISLDRSPRKLTIVPWPGGGGMNEWVWNESM